MVVRTSHQWHDQTVPAVPESVRLVRYTTALALTAFGVIPGSPIADAMLLSVSELVSNAVRHAADRSPAIGVKLTVTGSCLTVAVADTHPSFPSLTGETMGSGLQTIFELASRHSGMVTVEPVPIGNGKTIFVSFPYG
ncbi:ATP-binding protein [Streptomyces sp. BA2]|uniref:ATP-binding protein n=1 Tax=Streptomyces sp. BA2 TaxID=436595 RepID=UPI00132791F9|nr:ATP-binding protein [Streptomyces sp. BA2]MWA07875.1 ATP-binding protein [Streptomyces sp. BA2]